MIDHNANLPNLEGLSSLIQIGGGLHLLFNNTLNTLHGLEALESVGAEFELIFNPQLHNVSALANMTSFGNNIMISGNPSLENLSAIRLPESFNGILEISGNASLVSLTSDDGFLRILNELIIKNNRSLTVLSGLNLLQFVGQLHIFNNDALSHLEGLGALTTIERDARIQLNKNLKALTGFHSLASIFGILDISNNERLTSLTGLDALDEIGAGLVMLFNDSLSECAIVSVCNHLASGRPANIGGNSSGCSSNDQIMEACIVAAEDPAQEPDMTVFPNPTSGVIELKGLNQETALITIYDTHGRKVLQLNHTQETIDVTSLPDGIYSIWIQLEKSGIVKRFSKF